MKQNKIKEIKTKTSLNERKNKFEWNKNKIKRNRKKQKRKLIEVKKQGKGKKKLPTISTMCGMDLKNWGLGVSPFGEKVVGFGGINLG